MAWFDFFWTQDIIDHLAEHGVTPEEFAEVVMHADVYSKSRIAPRLVALGYTSRGRYLKCVYEIEDDEITVIPVTGYDY